MNKDMFKNLSSYYKSNKKHKKFTGIILFNFFKIKIEQSIYWSHYIALEILILIHVTTKIIKHKNN